MMHRYPGTQPFTNAQQHMFHGRKLELEDLLRLIRFHQTVILHSKSGLGKSSLLNAALAPEVLVRNIAQPVFVRFNAWSLPDSLNQTPLDRTFTALMPKTKGAISEIANTPSLWLAAKAHQLERKHPRVLLIFDQFEELFTYPESLIDAFKTELTELLRAGLPQRFESLISNLKLTEAQLEILYKPADVKVLFAIRSDRMHKLDKLSDFLPNILRNSYELLALTSDDALEAIVAPANAEGDFLSPKFGYETEALNQIINFLKDDEQRVEAIQLQTLCQAFERKMSLIKDSINPNGVEDRKSRIILAEDTDESVLKSIIKDYYLNQLADPSLVDENEIARKLIEEELVIETELGKGVRITMHELSLLAKFSTSGEPASEANRLRKLLDKLVNLHLLRREVGARGGDTYELSHDRLIAPVLASKQERIENEAEIKRQQREMLVKLQLAEEQRLRIKTRRVAWGLGVLSIVSLVALLSAWWQYLEAVDAKNAVSIEAKKTTEALNKYELEKTQRRELEATELLRIAENGLELGYKDIVLRRLREAQASGNNDIRIEQKISEISEMK